MTFKASLIRESESMLPAGEITFEHNALLVLALDASLRVFAENGVHVEAGDLILIQNNHHLGLYRWTGNTELRGAFEPIWNRSSPSVDSITAHKNSSSVHVHH